MPPSLAAGLDDVSIKWCVTSSKGIQLDNQLIDQPSRIMIVPTFCISDIEKFDIIIARTNEHNIDARQLLHVN